MNSKSVKEGGKHNMYSKSKRFIASFLAVLMAVCMLPADMLGAAGVVHAADGDITFAFTAPTGENGAVETVTSGDVEAGTTVTVTPTLKSGESGTIVYVMEPENDNDNKYGKIADDVVLSDGDEEGNALTDGAFTIDASAAGEVKFKAFTVDSQEDGGTTTKTYKHVVAGSFVFKAATLSTTAAPTKGTVTKITEGADSGKYKATLNVADGAVVKYVIKTDSNASTTADDLFAANPDSSVLTYDATTGIVIAADTTIIASAKKDGENASAATEIAFTIPTQVGTIVPSTGAGAVTSGTKITLSYTKVANETAEIYYTTEAAKATSAEVLAVDANKYTDGTEITITVATTIYAVAKVVSDDTLGSLQSFAYTIKPADVDPPAPGTKLNRQLNMEDVAVSIGNGEEKTRNGFTLIGSLGYTAENKTLDNVTYHGRYQLGKLSGPDSLNTDRVTEGKVNGAVKFDAQEDAEITMWGRGGKDADTPKPLVCKFNGTSLVEVAAFKDGLNDISSGVLMKVHAELEEAGTYYIVNATNNSSYNLYKIQVVYDGVDDFTDDATVKVSFNTDGGTTVADQDVVTNTTISEPATIKDGFEVDGWYKDQALTQAFDFANDVVTEEMTLYVKWKADTTRTPLTLNISNLPTGSFAKGFTKNDFTVGTGVSIVAEEKTVDGVNYTKNLKFGGASGSDEGKRDFVFNITKPSRLVVVAAAGANTDTRVLKVATTVGEGDNATTVEQQIMGTITTPATNEVFLATAGKYRIYCTGDFKIYYLSVDNKLIAPTIKTSATGDLEQSDTITITNPNNAGSTSEIKYTVNDGAEQTYDGTLMAGDLAGEDGGQVTIKAKVVPKSTNTDNTASAEVTATYTVKAAGGGGDNPPVNPNDPDDETGYWARDLAEIQEALGLAADKIPEGLWIAGINPAGYSYYFGAKITPATMGYAYDDEEEAYSWGIRVYHGDTLLKEKVDYTVSYKNNVNVPEADAAETKQPQVVVKGKGNYSGSAYRVFKITPWDVENTYHDDAMAVTAKKNDASQKPLPTLYEYNEMSGKQYKLKNKTDYDLKYYAADIASPTDTDLKDDVGAPKAYKVRVIGKKNFTGSVDIDLTVLKADGTEGIPASKLKVTAKKQAFDKTKAEAGITTDVTVKANGKPLEEGEDKDYTLEYENNHNPGTATIYIKPVTPTDPTKTQAFVGTKTVTFKITGPAIKSCKVEVDKAKLEFYGNTEEFIAGIKDAVKVKKGTTELQKERTQTAEPEYYCDVYFVDSTLTKVAVYVEAEDMSGYEGSVTKIFKVAPVKVDDSAKIKAEVVYPEDEIDAQAEDTTPKYPFSKGGAKPSVNVTYIKTEGTTTTDLYTFTEGKDYTLSYTKNKAVGAAKVNIKGKGLLKGTLKLDFEIGEKDFSKVTLVANDIALNKKNYDCKPYLVDEDGVKLAKKDYTLKYYDVTPAKADEEEQTPSTSVVITDGEDNTDPAPTEEGTEIAKITKYDDGKGKGSVIKVVATPVAGKGYSGDPIRTTYEVREKNFAKVKVGKIEAKEVTGKAITLSAADLKDKIKDGSDNLEVAVYENGELKSGNFVIDGSSYVNNTKKGTAKVTLVGVGDYAGTKTVSFKITAKKVEWWKPGTTGGDAVEFIKNAINGLLN